MEADRREPKPLAARIEPGSNRSGSPPSAKCRFPCRMHPRSVWLNIIGRCVHPSCLESPSVSCPKHHFSSGRGLPSDRGSKGNAQISFPASVSLPWFETPISRWEKMLPERYRLSATSQSSPSREGLDFRTDFYQKQLGRSQPEQPAGRVQQFSNRSGVVDFVHEQLEFGRIHSDDMLFLGVGLRIHVGHEL
jgi:hypothetical protein